MDNLVVSFDILLHNTIISHRWEQSRPTLSIYMGGFPVGPSYSSVLVFIWDQGNYSEVEYCGVRQRKHGIYLLRIWSRKIHCKKWWFHSTLLWSKFGYVFSAYNVRDGGEKMEKSIYEKGMKLLIWGAVISAVLVSIITGFTLEKLLVCTIIGIVGIICWRLR